MSEWHRKAVIKYLYQSGKTQAEIGKAIGVAGPSVGRWIAGRADISPKYYAKIEAITGCSAKSEKCLLDGDLCPICTNQKIDHLTAEALCLWKELDYSYRLRIVDLMKRHQQKAEQIIKRKTDI